MAMKPLKEMTNEELADLVEFIAEHHNKRLKTSFDLKRAPAVLRGEAEFPEDFTLFNRSGAYELFDGPSFMFSVYEQLIDRLQPPVITLRDIEVASLESISSTGYMLTEFEGSRVMSPDKVTGRLFDLGLVTQPTRNMGTTKIALTDAGVLALKESAPAFSM